MFTTISFFKLTLTLFEERVLHLNKIRYEARFCQELSCQDKFKLNQKPFQNGGHIITLVENFLEIIKIIAIGLHLFNCLQIFLKRYEKITLYLI